MRRWGSVIDLPDTSLSGMYTKSFSLNGIVEDEYLNQAGADDRSDEVPAILPFASKMIGFTYEWRDANDEAGVRLYKAANAADNSTGVIVYSVDIINSRNGSIATDVDFDAGDKIALFIEDEGGNPRDPHFTFYFVPTVTTFQVFSNNLNSDFP